jgi:hypothetical protein
MSRETYCKLAWTLSIHYPDFPVHCQSDRPQNPQSVLLDQIAIFYDYVIIDSFRYYASMVVGSHQASLVDVNTNVNAIPSTGLRCGELLEILQVDSLRSTNGRPIWLGRICWFKEWTGPREAIWDT